jgi:hypothetical protein
MPRSLQEALDASRDPNPEVRRLAVRDLCPCQVKMKDREVWDRVFEMTRDPNLRVRRNAFHAIIDGLPGALTEQAVKTLEAMREEPEAGLRRNVRKVLARHHRTGRINER